MPRIVCQAAKLAAFCLVVAGLSYSQMGTFMGKVIGPDGKGLQNAVIKIERKDIKGNWQTKTNRRGDWIYSGMQVGGTYRIECHVNNQLMDVVDGVRASLGEPVEVNFDLKKIADRQKAQQKALETGQLTEEMARDMTPEQRAAMEKQMKAQQAKLAANKALNDAFNEGMTALNARDYPVAVQGFSKAAEISPKEFAVWANLAAAHEGLANTQAGPARDESLSKAGEAYTKALEIKPDDAGVHNNFALCLVKQKKLDEAKEMLAKAALLDPPGAGRYYFNLGAVMVNTGQSDAAVEAFKKAVEGDPNHADSWYYLGNVLSGKMTLTTDGKVVPPEGMVEALERYLKLQPTGTHAEAAKGLLAVVQGTIETKYTNPDAKKGKKK